MNQKRPARRAAALMAGMLLAGSLTACGTSETQADTSSAAAASGTSITTSILSSAEMTVTCDTSDGYDLVHQGVNFDVSKDGKVVAYGFLILKADYDSYVSAAKSASDCTTTTINGSSVITYTDSDIAEALIAVPDDKNYIYLRDPNGMDSMNEVLQHLTFTAAS
ncbi:MAG: hypothetical protein ACI361_08955 [Atopobiaceae bacterium]